MSGARLPFVHVNSWRAHEAGKRYKAENEESKNFHNKSTYISNRPKNSRQGLPTTYYMIGASNLPETHTVSGRYFNFLHLVTGSD